MIKFDKTFKLHNDYPSVVIKDNIEYKNVVYTNRDFCDAVIKQLSHLFQPDNTFLEPFRGSGNFYTAMKKYSDNVDWCEIMEGKDFLQYDKKVDWIISNPPWSNRIGTAPMLHSFDIATNVVYLAPLKAFSTTKKWTYPLLKGFSQPTITPVSWKDAGLHFMDGKLKGGEGFMLCILYWKKL